MEAVRPKRTKAKTSGKSQLVRKQKQAEEHKGATAPSAVCDEAFTDIPLSLQEPVEEQRDSVQTPKITAQPSDRPSEKHQTSSSHTLSTSVLTLQSPLTPQETVPLTDSKDEEEEDGGVADQGAELKVEEQNTELGNYTQSWNQPCVSTQFQIPHAPSAPALYPCLPTLEEGPMMSLCQEAVKERAERTCSVVAS
ncbi:hypothetical protein OYC64_002845 [Pagothenia borchgrevinki]|uniref:Uncharacterized protein n=1 Tax=Pagothenia borchgrevinki TaxID=8213 RepID=A0ABD2HB76_PAGBO